MSGDTFLAISLIGFGVQQFLQMLADPIISIRISMIRDRQPPRPDGTKALPFGISDVDAKRAALGVVAFLLGLLVVIVSNSTFLLIATALKIEGVPRELDIFITALTIAAGTEGANSILKLLQYTKDAVKARTPPAVAQNSPVPQQPEQLTDTAGSDHGAGFDPQVTPNSGDDEDADDPGAAPGAGTTLAPEAASAISWRAANCLLKLRTQVNQQAPGRSKRADGLIGDAAHASRNSDHNPWVRDGNTGVVTAIDITHDPARGCDAGKIAEALRVSRDARIKYIIYKRRIASSAPMGGRPAWEWRPYTGKNPHTSHVHLSVMPEKRLYDSTGDWRL